MASLLIPEINEWTFSQLRDRAAASGRSVEEEARELLEGAFSSRGVAAWKSAKAIRDRLSASGRSFSDSADLIREDRDR